MAAAQLLGLQHAGLFAPESRYACAQAVQEFKSLVRTLHAAAIEVILDVVYSHGCEGGELGPDASRYPLRVSSRAVLMRPQLAARAPESALEPT
jgi:hypothetical protein